MVKVALVGDSIRMGYAKMVNAELADTARVWSPGANCGPSSRIMAHLDEWITTPGADILHLNCGLHDLRRERGNEQPVVPLPAYKENLLAILGYAREAGIRHVIFALTTPVNEAWHHKAKDFDRLEADVTEYNAAAREAAGATGATVNDLYAVVKAAGQDAIMAPDGVHYIDAGYRILGRAVADYIRPLLA
jgi:isoamyl acetate esterase